MTSAILENNVWSRRGYLYRRCTWIGQLYEQIRRRTVATWSWISILRPMAFKRMIDLAFSVTLVILTAPLWAPIFAIVKMAGGGIEGKQRVGRFLRTFKMLRLYSTNPVVHRFLEFSKVQYLPVFWNIVKGDMSIVGPRPTPVDELDLRSGPARRRHNDRPGLLCLWWIRSRAWPWWL